MQKKQQIWSTYLIDENEVKLEVAKELEQAKAVKPPVPILKRCPRDPASGEPPLPIDPDKNDCDDCELGLVIRRHTRQHPLARIAHLDLPAADECQHRLQRSDRHHAGERIA